MVGSQRKFVKHLNVYLIIWWPKRYENVMENYGWLQLFCKWFVFLYKRCPLLAVNCCQYRLTKYKEGGSVNVVVTNKHGYVGGDGIWDWVARPSEFMQSGDQQVWLVWVGILTRLYKEKTVVLVISAVIIPPFCLLPPSLGKHWNLLDERRS